jgi:hypothetical protein
MKEVEIKFDEGRYTLVSTVVKGTDIQRKRRFKIGQKVHKFTIASNYFSLMNISKSGNEIISYWVMAQCKCGTIKAVEPRILRSGATKSCGCYQTDSLKRRLTKGSLAKNGKKKCSSCLEIKSIKYFYRNKTKDDGLEGRCKLCMYFKDIKCQYGIDKVGYIDLLKQQNYLCAICKCDIDVYEDKKTTACVDHCHHTGQIRGLLCMKCNAGLITNHTTSQILKSAILHLSQIAKLDDTPINLPTRRYDTSTHRCGTCERDIAIKYFVTFKNKTQKLCHECMNINTIHTKYKLTKYQYLNLITAQNYQCNICKKSVGLTLDDAETGSVEHCHDTNHIRGITCRNCNTMISHLKENQKIITSAIQYLEKQGCELSVCSPQPC